MNLQSPIFLGKIFRDYLSDIDRIKYFNYEKLKKYQNKKFCEILKYSYKIPMYKQKINNLNLNLDEIKGVDDSIKLPVINRNDIIENYPDKIKNNNDKNILTVNTSGSTRNPVTLYMDSYTLMRSLIAYVREMRQYGIHWAKSKITIIANFYSQTAPTQYFTSGTNPTFKIIKPLISLKNIQTINADDDLLEITKKVDKFNPECILGFPGPLRHIAIYKQKGYAKNINPKCIISSGCLISSYQKKFISKVFNTPVYDVYGATEAGPIAFECECNNFHINSDFVYLETIDKNGNKIKKDKPGRLALTRLYGRGTPLIRYTGLGDVIILSSKKCSCGRDTGILKEVCGRIKETIVLPDRIIFPNALNEIPDKVMWDLDTDKIERLQIVQNSLKKITVNVIINKKKRNSKPSVKKLFNELKNQYQKIVGNKVMIQIKEVKKLVSEEKNVESTPGIIPSINADKYIS